MDEPYLAALRDLNAALNDLGIEAVVIGGVAVSLMAQPRYTEDVDAIILFDVEAVNDLLASLDAHSFHPRFAGMAEFATQARLVTVVHEPTRTVVDIMLGCMPFEEELSRRARTYHAADLAIRLPSPEDLIVLKAIANRPKDQEDIRNIASAHPMLDKAYTERWVSEYGELLEKPDLWDEIKPLLQE